MISVIFFKCQNCSKKKTSSIINGCDGDSGSSICISTSLTKLPGVENDFVHWSQESSFSPVHLYIFKWPDIEKILEHWSQENGFSPLCVH